MGYGGHGSLQRDTVTTFPSQWGASPPNQLLTYYSLLSWLQPRCVSCGESRHHVAFDQQQLPRLQTHVQNQHGSSQQLASTLVQDPGYRAIGGTVELCRQ